MIFKLKEKLLFCINFVKIISQSQTIYNGRSGCIWTWNWEKLTTDKLIRIWIPNI